MSQVVGKPANSSLVPPLCEPSPNSRPGVLFGSPRSEAPHVVEVQLSPSGESFEINHQTARHSHFPPFDLIPGQLPNGCSSSMVGHTLRADVGTHGNVGGSAGTSHPPRAAGDPSPERATGRDGGNRDAESPDRCRGGAPNPATVPPPSGPSPPWQAGRRPPPQRWPRRALPPAPTSPVPRRALRGWRRWRRRRWPSPGSS